MTMTAPAKNPAFPRVEVAYAFKLASRGRWAHNLDLPHSEVGDSPSVMVRSMDFQFVL
jgi:hypothetical protein